MSRKRNLNVIERPLFVCLPVSISVFDLYESGDSFPVPIVLSDSVFYLVSSVLKYLDVYIDPLVGVLEPLLCQYKVSFCGFVFDMHVRYRFNECYYGFIKLPFSL